MIFKKPLQQEKKESPLEPEKKEAPKEPEKKEEPKQLEKKESGFSSTKSFDRPICSQPILGLKILKQKNSSEISDEVSSGTDSKIKQATSLKGSRNKSEFKRMNSIEQITMEEDENDESASESQTPDSKKDAVSKINRPQSQERCSADNAEDEAQSFEKLVDVNNKIYGSKLEVIDDEDSQSSQNSASKQK